MRKEQHAQQKTLDALAHAQQRRARRLKKVEKARARLEKAMEKLRTLEDEIATLVYHSGDTRAQPPGQAASQEHTTHRALPPEQDWGGRDRRWLGRSGSEVLHRLA